MPFCNSDGANPEHTSVVLARRSDIDEQQQPYDRLDSYHDARKQETEGQPIGPGWHSKLRISARKSPRSLSPLILKYRKEFGFSELPPKLAPLRIWQHSQFHKVKVFSVASNDHHFARAINLSQEMHYTPISAAQELLYTP
ncbi:hypothetical protein PG993_008942 [Apiospora rasikravindrae]|uniref:Uncharacterized protein n=1 Tax=Apiospora rasikravindrae TaxID=990691 RepID=A0ABR1SPR9_9PEZI